MTLVLGIDPSAAKIAFVAIETVTGTYCVESQKLYPKGTTKQTPESLGNALEFMSHCLQAVAHIRTSDRNFAYVESPLVGRGGASATIKQAYVGGIIRGCLAEAGFRVYDAHPSTWRAGLGIKGKGTAQFKAITTQTVKQRASKLHSLVQHDGDLVDAAGIALYGVAQADKARRIASADPSGGGMQGQGSDVVVRPARVRPRVRQR